MTTPDNQITSRYFFDDVTVERENFRILKAGQARELEPRVFDLLVFLIERRGRVLEKQEIFEQVWKDAYVTDNALTRAIKEIRRAIGDDASAPRYIETVPKRGYRFIAEVKESEPVKPAEPVTLSEPVTPPVAQTVIPGVEPRPVRRNYIIIVPLTVGFLIIAATAVWFYQRSANLAWAREQVPRVEGLAKLQKYFEAYDLATRAQEYLPDDPAITRLMPAISDAISVTTEPSGATVFLRRFKPDAAGKSPPREKVGTTPINGLRVARGEYILYIEKDGYATIERTVSSLLTRVGNAMLPPDEPNVFEHKLLETDKVPERMVRVPGGRYKLVNWRRPTEATAQLSDHFMDKYEVTNREYKEFINAGGYLKKQFWKYPFVKDGKPLGWEEAIKKFKDQTGLQGPRSWKNQDYPEGKAEHPVTDVTWYEAAAYAEFRGKHLPTVFQWEKAARDGIFTHYTSTIMPWGPIEAGGAVEHHANFKSGGTAPVDSFEFGMSPYGCYNMAGNVSEWCLNEVTEGFVTGGGSWDDLSYLFGYTGALPGFYSSSKVGFRCALNPDGGDQGAMRFDTMSEIPTYVPTTDQAFRSMAGHFLYDKTPLKAEIVETVETAEWRREKITYLGANDDRVTAYLYLPKNYQRPFQVIQFLPAGDVYGGYITIAESVEMILTPHIKSGRAVFAVVLKGFKEREYPAEYVRPSYKTVKHREEIVNNMIDLRRGLDYLETRDDIDTGRIAVYGYSQGGEYSLIYAAIENRCRFLIMIGVGLPESSLTRIAEASPLNFAPHIRASKLALNGRYDEASPFKTYAEPMFKLLREPKRQVLYDGSHTPPSEVAVPMINGWLDENLGPTRPDS